MNTYALRKSCQEPQIFPENLVLGASGRDEWLSQRPDLYWLRWRTAVSWKTNKKLLHESRELLTLGTWHCFSIHLNQEILISCNKDFTKWFFSVPQTIPLVNIYWSWLVKQVSFKSLSILNFSQPTHLQEYPGCYSFDRDHTQSGVEVEKLAFPTVAMYQ